MAGTEVERHEGRDIPDVEDVPSAAWGWSSENRTIIYASALVSVLFLLAMLHGNHTGRVEDLFLIGFSVAILFGVGRDWWLRRRGWTR